MAPPPKKPTLRPRTKPPAKRKEELLDAAEHAFLARGVAATSVDHIVAAAQVAKGTFYLYFPSRDDVLVALKQRFVSRFAHALSQAVERRPADDWHGRLRAWLAAGVDFYRAQVALHDVVFHDFHSAHPRTDHVDETVEQLTAFLTAGERAGAWTLPSPRLTATMLFAALHGALDDAALQKLRRARLLRALEWFFTRVLTGKS